VMTVVIDRGVRIDDCRVIRSSDCRSRLRIADRVLDCEWRLMIVECGG
jgi:hypothetical protein